MDSYKYYITNKFYEGSITRKSFMKAHVMACSSNNYRPAY